VAHQHHLLKVCLAVVQQIALKLLLRHVLTFCWCCSKALAVQIEYGHPRQRLFLSQAESIYSQDDKCCCLYLCLLMCHPRQGAMRTVPHEPLTQPGPPPGIYASAYHTLTAILGQLVAARLALQHNNTAGAVEALTEAVALEDGLGYMEPPRYY